MGLSLRPPITRAIIGLVWALRSFYDYISQLLLSLSFPDVKISFLSFFLKEKSNVDQNSLLKQDA